MKYTMSLSGWVCPYAAHNLELGICCYVFIAVNQRRQRFHMDTHRADSDPDDTWTKTVNSVRGFRPPSFSQPALYMFCFFILVPSRNVKGINITERKKQHIRVRPLVSSSSVFQSELRTDRRQTLEYNIMMQITATSLVQLTRGLTCSHKSTTFTHRGIITSRSFIITTTVG